MSVTVCAYSDDPVDIALLPGYQTLYSQHYVISWLSTVFLCVLQLYVRYKFSLDVPNTSPFIIRLIRSR